MPRSRCEQKFFKCEVCGNITGLIADVGVPMICCEQPMVELEANTVDASYEKHVPVATIKDHIVDVNIGSEDHPMTSSHYIEWIYLMTENGGQRKCLLPGEKPHATFALVDDNAISVFAYCNLHGLWKTDL